MSERAPRPTRDDYVVWRRATTRWADDDAYGHMNNATYYELFDTAVNAHLFEATGVNVRALPSIGVVAETSCRYFREIGFPEPVDMGLAVERVGTSSVIYRIGLFQGDSDDRPVTPLPDEIRSVVTALVPAG
jgi:acyl-CoA thioesterase FadM